MAASKSSEKQLPALWEAGVPLDSAWITFGTSFDHSTAKPRNSELRGLIPETREGRRQKALVTAINGRGHLLDEIYAGRLWAIGFRTPASGSDKIVRVPGRHFYSVNGVRPAIDINWNTDELTVDGTEYFDIRVVRNPLTSETNLSPKDESDGSRRSKAKKSPSNSVRQIKRGSTSKKKTQRKKVGGRPNTRKEIRKVTLDLLSKKPVLANLPIKLLIGHVRAAICGEEKRNEEEKGYRSPSMIKIVGPAVQDFRKQNKRNKPNKP